MATMSDSPIRHSEVRDDPAVCAARLLQAEALLVQAREGLMGRINLAKRVSLARDIGKFFVDGLPDDSTTDDPRGV